jgi:hypothetical protein
MSCHFFFFHFSSHSKMSSHTHTIISLKTIKNSKKKKKKKKEPITIGSILFSLPLAPLSPAVDLSLMVFLSLLSYGDGVDVGLDVDQFGERERKHTTICFLSLPHMFFLFYLGKWLKIRLWMRGCCGGSRSNFSLHIGLSPPSLLLSLSI